MQDFDYPDYEAERFLDVIGFSSEQAATWAINELLGSIARDRDAFERDLPYAYALRQAGAPMTRRQALLVFLLSS